MRLVKGKNIDTIPSGEDKMQELFEENAGHITEFFNETIERYKNGEILNFVIITEDQDDGRETDDIEIFALSHSTVKHLRGLLADAIVTVRRRAWGEEDEEE